MTTAQTLANFRRKFGVTVTYKGNPYKATRAALKVRDVPDMVFEGVRNAADTDIHAFSLTIADFTTLPAEGEELLCDGQTFIILRPYKTNLLTAYRVLTYRKPQLDSATVDTGTGLRKQYVPPVNTH